MSFELNQTAVSAAPLLRAIEAGGWTTNADLATRAGRAPKNLSRDLTVLRNEGLIEPDMVILTDLGQAQLAAIARAENAAPALAEDERLVTHGQMRPDPDNPRKDFDSAEAQEKLDELRTSILEKGLLQNFVCRPDHSGEADYIVTDGNRRWHAIAQAVFDADWPEDRLLRIKVLDTDECESLITAVVANMQRADMSPLEEAEAFDKLINAHGLKTIDIANQTGLSQKVVQNRLKLLKLSEDDRDRMRLPEDHADHLNYKAALKSLTVARESAAEPAPDEIEHQEPERRLLTVADFGVPADWRATDVADAASWIEPFTMERFEYRDKKWTLTIQVAQLVGGEGWVHGTSSDGPTQGSYSTLNGVWSGHMPAYQTREKAIACAAAYITASVLGKAPAKAMAWLDNPTADEPGSPAEAPAGAGAPSLGKTLSDAEALIIAEVADKAERHPHPIHPSYAFCLPSANQAGVPHLVARGLLATRVIGGDMLIRPALHSGGVKEWLESIGFYGDRDELLFELAARVQGADNVINRQQSGVRYATAWLNLTGDPRNDAAEPAPVRDRSQDAADALAYGMTALEPEQPALIEETAEERAARRRAEQMAAEAAFDDRAVMAFAEAMRRKMALKRSQGASGWAGASVNELADLLVGHVAKGDPVDIGLFAMMVAHRAEAVGYQRTPDVLRTMPIPRMEQLMIAARAARQATQEEEGEAEPDPVNDFVEAEVEEGEDDAGGVMANSSAYSPGPSDPAVPIRKSITPDFIVCLEDGRKFKSLKRHLRTKYNLSPEEYRAKWGLPRDYPMVAPNYAKARADLARQMGLAQ